MRCVIPGSTETDRYLQRHREFDGRAHFFSHELLNLLVLARSHLNDELVVYLQTQY